MLTDNLGAVPVAKFLAKIGEDDHLIVKPFFRKVALDMDITAKQEADMDRWFVRLINSPDISNIIVNAVQGVYEFGLGALFVYFYKKFMPTVPAPDAGAANNVLPQVQLGDIEGNQGLNMAAAEEL